MGEAPARSHQRSSASRRSEACSSRWGQIPRFEPEDDHGFNGRDAAYWYTERANVGLLAAAAWMEDVPALEEFNEQKRGGRGKYAGRVDLCLHLNRKCRLSLEAKMVWLHLGGGAAEELDAARKSADASAKALCVNECEKRFAAVLAVPSSPPDELATAKEKTIEAVEGLRREVGAARSFSAYAFLRTRPRAELPCWKGNVFPGVALVGWQEDLRRS